ncbi:MAG: DNA-binding response regulator [Actinomycetales bacterium]|nr:MAG: DNA-binding response regulator [Actinomycetales bacterium]
MVKLIVIDDDPLVRTGLKLLLDGRDGIEVIAEGTDGDEAEDLVNKYHPDVVLMDIRMARLDGLTATERLLAKPAPPKVIILTTFDADDLVLRALGAGAAGFLLKDTDPDEMVSAIGKVAAGEQTLSPKIISQVIEVATRGLGSSRRDAARAELAKLSHRELEVAKAIGRGETNQDIANSQFISVATVKSTVTTVLQKLAASNRVQVAIRVHDAELD